MEHYSKTVIRDLSIIYGESERIIDRICRNFDIKYPEILRMTKRKFLRIKRNFDEYGRTAYFRITLS